MCVEYGSLGAIRFLNPEFVRLYDSEGKLMLCKCGKPAGSGCIGKEAYVMWCEDCSPLYKETETFVYRKIDTNVG